MDAVDWKASTGHHDDSSQHSVVRGLRLFVFSAYMAQETKVMTTLRWDIYHESRFGLEPTFYASFIFVTSLIMIFLQRT